MTKNLKTRLRKAFDDNHNRIIPMETRTLTIAQFQDLTKAGTIINSDTRSKNQIYKKAEDLLKRIRISPNWEFVFKGWHDAKGNLHVINASELLFVAEFIGALPPSISRLRMMLRTHVRINALEYWKNGQVALGPWPDEELQKIVTEFLV